MEVCLVCFNKLEGHIYLSPTDSEKIFNYCLSSLHTAVAESCKDFLSTGKNQMSFCKRCFDSAVQLSHLSEQITAFQKELSDLTQEFSISVLHRRSQANSNKGNAYRHQSHQLNIQIDVLAFPPQLFSPVTPQLSSASTPHFFPEEINVVNQTSPCKFQNESLNTVTVENVKLEFNEDVNGFVSNNLLLEDNLELENEDIFIEGLPGEIKERDGRSVDFKVYEHEEDPLSVNKVKKPSTIVKKRRKFVRKGVLGDTKTVLLNSVQYPRIILEKVKPQACARSNVSSVKKETPTLYGKEDFGSPSNNSSYSSTVKVQIRKNEKRSQKIKKIYSSNSLKLQSSIKKQRRESKLNTNGNSVSCELCDKIFSQKCHLKDHMRLHTGEKPYKCPFCPKSFAQYGNLYSHKKIHTGEMPHKCFYCEKRFSGNNYRKKHMKSKHSDCFGG